MPSRALLAAVAAVALAAGACTDSTPAVDAPSASEAPDIAETPTDAEPTTFRRDDAAAALAASCEVLATEPVEGAEHHDPATAPPADVLYEGQPRPAHSGPHFAATAPIVRPSTQMESVDERALVHNLEHGSVIVWIDPESPEATAIVEWGGRLQDAGFTEPRAGVAVFVMPWDTNDPSDVLLRAWGQALDCTSWNEDVANAFVFDHYGSHGGAPEGSFGPFPEGAMQDVTPAEA